MLSKRHSWRLLNCSPVSLWFFLFFYFYKAFDWGHWKHKAVFTCADLENIWNEPRSWIQGVTKRQNALLPRVSGYACMCYLCKLLSVCNVPIMFRRMALLTCTGSSWCWCLLVWMFFLFSKTFLQAPAEAGLIVLLYLVSQGENSA